MYTSVDFMVSHQTHSYSPQLIDFLVAQLKEDSSRVKGCFVSAYWSMFLVCSFTEMEGTSQWTRYIHSHNKDMLCDEAIYTQNADVMKEKEKETKEE